MAERVIEIEAETLEEARKQAEAQTPEGFYVVSEDIILDGKPITKNRQTIEVEADSLEEARSQLNSQIPEGLILLSESILSDGKLQKVEAVAETREAAFAEAQTRLPSNAEVLEKKVITAPEQKTITVEAFDEQIAMSIVRSKAHRELGNAVIVKGVKLILTGSKGFLGIGKKPHRYEAELLQQANVEITYRPKVKISVEIGEIQQSKAKIAMKISDEVKKTQGKMLFSTPVCDVCSKPMDYSDGYALTTTQVTTNEKYWEFILTHHDLQETENLIGLAMYVKQQAMHTTGWLVCESCGKLFDFDKKQAKEYAKRQLDPPGSGPADESDATFAATKALVNKHRCPEKFANVMTTLGVYMTLE